MSERAMLQSRAPSVPDAAVTASLWSGPWGGPGCARMLRLAGCTRIVGGGIEIRAVRASVEPVQGPQSDDPCLLGCQQGAAAAERGRLAAAQDALSAMMEDVIAAMAGYVPLKAIAERILDAYARDPFGDFKARLWSACPPDLAIACTVAGLSGSWKPTRATP